MAESMGPVAARVERGNGVEAYHCASIVVIGSRGEITHSLGDPYLETFTRSSIKPFQALALVESGAADAYGLNEKELAICCGSHEGTDEHKLTAESILAKAGNRPEDLQCGAHWPNYMKSKNIYPIGDEDHDPTRNNCSGKHAGFLALTRHIKGDIGTYLDYDSKTQTAVRSQLAEAFGVDMSEAPHGVDGCSAPNYSIPIYNLATAFLKLATAEDGALLRLANAMRAYPEMVSGNGRFDTELMRAFKDNLVCKIGAEAIEAIALREPEVAIVVKIHDGGPRALYCVCIEVMKQLGLINKMHESLKRFASPQIKNHRGTVTGSIEAIFELKTHQTVSGAQRAHARSC